MKGSARIGFNGFVDEPFADRSVYPDPVDGVIVGKLFREFAVTLSVAIAVSLCVSLTTTPMMCAKSSGQQKDKKHGRLYLRRKMFQRSADSYTPECAGVASPAVHASRSRARRLPQRLLVYHRSKGFFPQQDTRPHCWKHIGAQDLSYPAMQEKLKQYTDIGDERSGGRRTCPATRVGGGKHGRNAD